jgi:hypothetical protein
MFLVLRLRSLDWRHAGSLAEKAGILAVGECKCSPELRWELALCWKRFHLGWVELVRSKPFLGYVFELRVALGSALGTVVGSVVETS